MDLRKEQEGGAMVTWVGRQGQTPEWEWGRKEVEGTDSLSHGIPRENTWFEDIDLHSVLDVYRVR